MTQVEILDADRDGRQRYKVDVNRGQRIGRVSSEWFSRPADERYLSLSDLYAALRGRTERSRTRTVESMAIRVRANRDDAERLALLLPGSNASIAPTHWSFGQLAILVGAPAAYLRQLPAPLAGINLQYGLTSHRAEQVKTLEIEDGRVELRAAGCDRIHQEHGSGLSRARPVLTKLLKDLTTGDVLVVVRLDRLARSVSHLLQVIEDLEKRGGHFRSLRDPIDTSTPQGMFSLQVFGAVAQLERALIVERTKAGIKAAKARGKLPGNPGLRERRPEAIKAVSQVREKLYLDELISSAQTWLPTVPQLRPQHSWDNVVRVLNRRGHDWTVERLRRAVHRMVREKLAEKELLARSPRRAPEDHLMKLVAAITIADPDLTLREIAAQLDQMGERPARGGRKWQPSSVRALLDEAHRFGLVRN